MAIPKLFTLDETCESLRTGRSTVFSYIRSGDLHSVMIGGKRLIPDTEIERVAREGLTHRNAATRARIAEAGAAASPRLGRRSKNSGGAR